jgi:hypothetical protein
MGYIGGPAKGFGRVERYVFTAAGSETSVTADDDSRPILYKAGAVDVFLNGVKLVNGTDFTATSENSITGLSALTNGDVLEVVAFDTYSVSKDAVIKSNNLSDLTNKSTARTNLQVPGSVTTGITGADAVTNIVSLTQAEYDAITPDASTLYVITT